MARTLLWIALTLALLSLAASLVARTLQAPSRAGAWSDTVLVPLAIVIGVLPGILNVESTPMRLGASAVSIGLSVTYLVMRIRGFRHRA